MIASYNSVRLPGLAIGGCVSVLAELGVFSSLISLFRVGESPSLVVVFCFLLDDFSVEAGSIVRLFCVVLEPWVSKLLVTVSSSSVSISSVSVSLVDGHIGHGFCGLSMQL